MNKTHYVSLLLSNNANPSIMNTEGYIPADLCTNEEIIKIINKETKFKEDNSNKKEV